MKVNLGHPQHQFGKASELLGDDLEFLLREINDFCGTNVARRENIPKILDDYLMYVARTGNPVFPWHQIRPLYRWKLQSSLAAFSEEPTPMETTVFERFDLFRSAPFTIQRLSELITEPRRHYKCKEKFLFALEKAVYVVSTVEPMSIEEAERAGEEGNGDVENIRPMGSSAGYHQNQGDGLTTSYLAPSMPPTAENMGLTGDITTSFPPEGTPPQTPEEAEIQIEVPMDSAALEVVVTEDELTTEEEAKVGNAENGTSIEIMEFNPLSGDDDTAVTEEDSTSSSVVSFPLEETENPMNPGICFEIVNMDVAEEMDSAPSNVETIVDIPTEYEQRDLPDSFVTLSPEEKNLETVDPDLGDTTDGVQLQKNEIVEVAEEPAAVVADDVAAGSAEIQGELNSSSDVDPSIESAPATTLADDKLN